MSEYLKVWLIFLFCLLFGFQHAQHKLTEKLFSLDEMTSIFLHVIVLL